MDFNSLAVFRMARTKMDYVSQNQKLIAENIANANTPEYRPRVLRKLDFRQMATDMMNTDPEQVVTQPGHIKASLPDQGPFQELRERHTYETSPDGNRVVVEEQVEKLSRGRSDYTLALNLVRKNMALLKTALGRSSG